MNKVKRFFLKMKENKEKKGSVPKEKEQIF